VSVSFGLAAWATVLWPWYFKTIEFCSTTTKYQPILLTKTTVICNNQPTNLVRATSPFTSNLLIPSANSQTCKFKSTLRLFAILTSQRQICASATSS